MNLYFYQSLTRKTHQNTYLKFINLPFQEGEWKSWNEQLAKEKEEEDIWVRKTLNKETRY